MGLDTLLTIGRTETLKAVVDRIIPADDYPGGWEAGVGSYFSQLFRREQRFLPVYRDGLDALDAEALATVGEPFVDLDSGEQDVLLTRVETGEVQARWPLDPETFFGLLVEQTTEGFYADPGNGGNKGGIAWAMMGYRVTT